MERVIFLLLPKVLKEFEDTPKRDHAIIVKHRALNQVSGLLYQTYSLLSDYFLDQSLFWKDRIPLVEVLQKATLA